MSYQAEKKIKNNPNSLQIVLKGLLVAEPPKKAFHTASHYTNMTSRGLSILSRGSYSWWKPHGDVISVLLYRTNTKHKRGKNYKHQRFG